MTKPFVKNVLKPVRARVVRATAPALLLAALLLLTTCDLFKAGLGAKVDITAPTISITSPGQNSYVKGALQVTGKASDDIKVSSVTVAYPAAGGVVNKTAALSNGTWSVEVPTGTAQSDNLPDGEQDLAVTVMDDSGKTTQADLLVYVDNVAPTVIVTVPQGRLASRPTLSDYIDVKGEVWDRSPIQSVSVRLRDSSGTTLASQVADGTNTWSTRLTITSLADQVQPYGYDVVVTDKAGNANTYFYHTQDIWALLAAKAPPSTPYPATDEIGKLDQSGTGTVTGFTYADLHGTRLGADSGLYGDFVKNSDATLPAVYFSNMDPASPAGNVLGTKVPIYGYIVPGPGNTPVEPGSVKAWITDAATPEYNASTQVDTTDIVRNTIGTSVTYQIEPRVGGVYLASGHYIVRVDASGQGSLTAKSEYCAFLVDSGAPRIEALDPDPSATPYLTRGVFASGPLVGQTGIGYRVKVTDDNAVAGVTAAASEGGTPVAGTQVSVPDIDHWYDVQLPLGPGHTTISFDLQATDNSGTIARRTVAYSIDESAPAVSVTAPGPGAWVTGNSTTVIGTSSDNSLVKTIYLWLGFPAAAAAPADLASWTAIDGNASWATSLALGAEGAYRIHVVAVDLAGNRSAEVTRDFYLDQANPDATETTVGSSTVSRNASFDLAGMASDSSALAALTITQRKDGGSVTTVLSSPFTGNPTSAAWSWTKTVNAVTHADDGTYEFTVSVTDTAGKTSPVLTRTVVVDSTPPVIALMGFVGGLNTALNQVNSTVTYRFSADGGAVAVEKSGSNFVGHYTVVPSGTPVNTSAAGVAAWTTVTSTSGLFTITSDSALWNGGLAGAYDLYVGAIDTVPGTPNAGWAKVDVDMDQASDRPVIQLGNLTAGVPASQNPLGRNPRVLGSVQDDDGVGPSGVQISIDGGAWAAVTTPPPAVGTLVSWSDDLGAITEGPHTLQVRSRDKNTTGDAVYGDASSFSWSESAAIAFFVDYGPPVLGITAPANGAVKTADFTISGTAQDSYGIDTVLISFDGGATQAASVSGATPQDKTWTYTFVVSGQDGPHGYQVIARDLSGAESTLDRQIVVDTIAPTTAVNTPQVNEITNGTFMVSGIASDNYQLTKVYSFIGARGAAAPDYRGPDALPGTGDDWTGWTALAQTYSWQFTLDTVALGDGDFTLHVRALDSGGNVQAGETVRDFTVNRASDRPVLTVSTLSETGTYKENLLPNTLQVAGTVSDDDAVKGSTIQVAVDRNGNGVFTDPGEIPWTAVSPAVLDGRVVTWANKFTGLADGQYELYVRAGDIYDAGYGSYSSGILGPVKFSVDTAPPAAAVTAPSQGAYSSALSLSITGTASDANGVANVQIKVGAAAPVDVTDTAVFPAAPFSTWSYAYGYVVDGQVSVQLIVTDTFDKVTTIDRSFTMDRTAPSVGFLQPTASSTVNGSLLVRGTASDTYQVSEVWMSLAPAAASPAWPADYQKVAGTFNWQQRIRTPDYADGSWKIRVVAIDGAGNTSAPEVLPVTFDQATNLPVITLATADGTLLDNTGVITGTVTDDDGVDPASIMIKIGSGSWVSVTSTTGSGTSVSFSHSVAGLAEQLAPYAVQISASDVGENFDGGDFSGPADVAPVSGAASLSIQKDNAPPTAAVTSLDNGQLTVTTLQSAYLKDRLTLQGTATDGVQVSTVEARLLVLGTEPFETVTNLGTHFSTWTWSKVGLSLSGSAVNLELRVTDAHGRVTTTAYTLLVDTAAPTLSIDTPASNPRTVDGRYNGGVTFRGSAADGIKVEKVYYRFGLSAAGQPNGTWAGWTLAGSTYSWTTAALDTNALYNDAVDHAFHLSAVAVDSAGNESAVQDVAFVINQASDRPSVTVTEPAAAQVLGAGARASGTTSDDDALASIEVRIDGNNDGDFLDAGEAYAAVDSPSSVSGGSAGWEENLAALADGSYRVQVRVRDDGYAGAPAAQQTFHETETAVVSFDIDSAPPSISLTKITVQDRYGGAARDITSAFSGSYVNNDSTFSFSAADGSGVAAVELSADNGATWLPGTNLGGGTWTRVLVVPLNQSYDGTRNIQYRATDNHGKVTTSVVTLIVDTLEPAVSFTSPAGVTTSVSNDAPNVNGDVTIQGTVSDSSAITGVTVKAGIADQISLTNTGNAISWKVTLAGSAAYANATYAVDQGSNVWRLPVKITATELAGNRSITTGWIDVDPNSDRPIVSLVSPLSGDSVAGVFLVSGTVVDDDGAQSVLLQLDLNNDGVYGANGPFTGALDLNNNGSTLDDFENETAYKTIAVSNGAWSILMNSSGELNKANLVARGLAGAEGHIGFKVTPVDINGTLGVPQSASIYIDSEAPVIKGLAPDGVTEVAAPTPATGTLQKGTVTLRALFRDDKDLLASSMQVSFDGGSTFQTIATVPGATITDTGATGPYAYRIVIPIDTTMVVAGGNGTLQVSLKVTDKTYKQTTQTVQYAVDNTLPEVAWNLPAALAYLGVIPNEVYSFQGSGSTTANEVFGKASDAGAVSGIAKVNVYFVRAGSFVNPRTGATQAVTTQTVRQSSLDRNGDGDYVDANEYVGTDRLIPFTEDPSLVISIDKRTELGQFDANVDLGDQDGFNESLKAKTGYDEWYAYFNSTLFTDGPVDVYFVAYDQAGNKVYGTALGQMANHPPAVGSVTVGAQTINDTATRAKVNGTVGFTLNATDVEGVAVSDFRLTVSRKFAVGSGGSLGAEQAFTPFWYGSQAVYGSTGWKADFSTRTPASGSATTASAQVSINTAAGDLPSGFWYLFEAQARDTDTNIATRDFYVWINNSDSSAPVVTVNDFGQASVAGVAGHVEAAPDSPGADGDADLSGTVKVTGTVYDDTAVSSVTLEVSANGGSTWSDLPAPVTSFGSPLSGNVIDGYTYAWSYTFDSSTISGGALLNLRIRARGFDGTNSGESASKTVDVVPYITDILTGMDTGLKTYVKRSALGKYTVARAATGTFTVVGYNLTASSTVTINGGAVTGTPSAGQFVVNNSLGYTSGPVVVTTNGASSQNNTNTNALAQNREAASYNPLWVDDRYIAFWDIVIPTTDGAAPGGSNRITGAGDPVMRPNAARNGFNWLYTLAGRELWLRQAVPNALINAGYTFKITEGNSLRGGDFTYNNSTDKSLLFVFDHDNKWHITRNDYAYYGSMQWGALPGGGYDFDQGTAGTQTYTMKAGVDEAYNWHYYQGFPKLGLGNESGDSTNVSMGYASPYTNYSLGRWGKPRIVAVGTNATTRNYVAYYDSATATKDIVFYAFKAGTTGAGGVNGSGSYYRRTGTTAGAITLVNGLAWVADIDKYFNQNNDSNTFSASGNMDNQSFGIAPPRGRQNVTGGATATSFDLAVFAKDATNHYGFIAWFDEATSSLSLRYKTDLYTADPLAVGNAWSSAIGIDTNAGRYVRMAVDPSGGLHLVYQDVNNGTLKYAYVTYTANTGSSPHTLSGFTVKKATVDALLNAGQYNSITIRDFGTADYRPVITTYSSALAGTTASLRVSYPVYAPSSGSFGDGVDAGGGFNQKWEVITVPAATAPQAAATFTETDGASYAAGKIYLGYSGSYLEEARFQEDTTRYVKRPDEP